MKVAKSSALLILLSGLFVCGCSDSAAKKEPNGKANATVKPSITVRGEKIADDAITTSASTDQDKIGNEMRLMELIQKADTMFYEGNTNDVIASLENALADPSLDFGRNEILRSLLRIELQADMADAARERMFKLYSEDVNTAEALCGTIYYNYIETGDTKGAIAWTEKVLALGKLTPSIRNNMREWNFLGYINIEDKEKVATLASNFISEAPVGNSLKILRRGTDILFNKKNYPLIETILAKSSSIITTDKETNDFVTLLRLRLWAMQGKWEQYRKLFYGAIAKCTDSEISTLLRRSLPAAVKSRNYTSLDAICEDVITNSVFRKMSYEYAARQWVDSAQATDLDSVPDRIDFLFNNGKQIDEVASIFIYHGYDNIDSESFVAEMKTIGERLVSAVPNDDLRGSVKTIVLDYSFVSKDYDTALKMLESGIGDNDKLWHDLAIAKVKAHKALIENRALDAIKNFRTFMTLMQSSEDSEAEEDPATGVIHTREMILGRNAKRIGDIYKSINDTAMATSAYDEARAYYKKTLDTETDPDTLAIAKREYAAIPEK